MTVSTVSIAQLPTLSSRAKQVRDKVQSILELSDWVSGERAAPPDLTGLNKNLTVASLERNHEDLREWKRMFGESLAHYRSLVDMEPAEWASLEASDIVGLEGMLKQATVGIIAFV